MKFLILTQYFPPEVGASQVRLAAFARELKRLGHEVEVVTALPNHPTGKIFEEYKGRFYVREVREGIPVHRVWLFPATGGGVKRILNYLSFAFASIFGLLKAKKPDFIFVESPPLFLSIPAWIMSKIWGAPYIFNVADLWPDSVRQLGVLSNRFVIKLAEMLESWTYGTARYVVAVTEGIRETLVHSKHVPSQKILYLPNGVDLDSFQMDSQDDKILCELGLCHLRRKKIILYAGTHGFAHGLHTAVHSAKLLAGEVDVVFLFVGDGSEKSKVRILADVVGAENTLFIDPMPPNELARLYSVAWAGLSVLRDNPLFEATRPVKIFSIMAAGKPVIYSGRGEGAQLVQDAKAGLVVPPEDPRALAEAVRHLAENPALAEEYGRNGRKYVEKYFSWQALVKNWLQQLETRELITSGGGP